MQVPTLLGVGRINVTLELPAAGGLYRFANVTYRGVQVGKVTEVKLTDNGAEATLTLDTSPKIPADLKADVRSVSAVGEQYVDLRPRTDSGPYLQDGSVIAMANTTIPQQVGPMLDQVSKLVNSIPEDRITDLLDESFKAFNGAGPDFSSLLDSARQLTEHLNSVSDQSRGLIDDSWAAAGFAGRDHRRDPDVGAQPGGCHRAGRAERPAGPRDPATRTRLRAGGFGAARLRSSRRCRCCWRTSPRSGRSWSPTTRRSNSSWCLPRRSIAAQQSFGLAKNNPTGPGDASDFALTIS